MATYKVPAIAGDGVGPEVISEGRKVLDAVSEMDGFEIEWIDYPFGSDHYLTTGELIGEDSLKELRQYKAIYLGALGDPKVPTGILELGILLKLRVYMDQYVNLRPIKLYEGVTTPLRDKTWKDINFHVVRENTEDFYIDLGSRVNRGISNQQHDLIRDIYSIKFNIDVDSNADEIAYQLGLISRKGAERVIRYAFDIAQKLGRTKVTSVDKANVINHVYSLWREVFEKVSSDFPEIQTEFTLADAISMWFVKNPEWFQVVVAPNLFGDIITDLGAIIQGGMGLAQGGNINPIGTSMFEPIHGSAPKYKGQNKVNPIAAILAGSMLLEELGLDKSAKKVEESVSQLLKDAKIRTFDIGGISKTSEVGNSIASLVKVK